MLNANQLSATLWRRRRTPNQFQLPGQPVLPDRVKHSVSVSGGLSSSGLTDYALQRQHRATTGIVTANIITPSGEGYTL